MRNENYLPIVRWSTEFQNTMRHMLSGNYKHGWIHAKIKIKINRAGLLVKWVSLEDESTLKKIQIDANITDGETIEFPGMIASYMINFHPEQKD